MPKFASYPSRDIGTEPLLSGGQGDGQTGVQERFERLLLSPFPLRTGGAQRSLLSEAQRNDPLAALHLETAPILQGERGVLFLSGYKCLTPYWMWSIAEARFTWVALPSTSYRGLSVQRKPLALDIQYRVWYVMDGRNCNLGIPHSFKKRRSGGRESKRGPVLPGRP